MNMYVWGSSIDECVKAWIVFIIDDEIIDELLYIVMKIGVIYVDDYDNMNHCYLLSLDKLIGVINGS